MGREGVGAQFSAFMKHTMCAKCRAGAHIVANFILIVACFARSVFTVARVLLFAQLSCLDGHAALASAHAASARGVGARLVAHTPRGI